MPYCVMPDATGNLQVVSTAPCPGGIVLTPSEFEALSSQPFLLTPEQGALISAAVIGVWAAAWCWKALGRALNDDGERT